MVSLLVCFKTAQLFYFSMAKKESVLLSKPRENNRPFIYSQTKKKSTNKREKQNINKIWERESVRVASINDYS